MVVSIEELIRAPLPQIRLIESGGISRGLDDSGYRCTCCSLPPSPPPPPLPPLPHLDTVGLQCLYRSPTGDTLTQYEACVSSRQQINVVHGHSAAPSRFSSLSHAHCAYVCVVFLLRFLQAPPVVLPLTLRPSLSRSNSEFVFILPRQKPPRPLFFPRVRAVPAVRVCVKSASR